MLCESSTSRSVVGVTLRFPNVSTPSGILRQRLFMRCRRRSSGRWRRQHAWRVGMPRRRGGWRWLCATGVTIRWLHSPKIFEAGGCPMLLPRVQVRESLLCVQVCVAACTSCLALWHPLLLVPRALYSTAVETTRRGANAAADNRDCDNHAKGWGGDKLMLFVGSGREPETSESKARVVGRGERVVFAREKVQQDASAFSLHSQGPWSTESDEGDTAEGHSPVH